MYNLYNENDIIENILLIFLHYLRVSPRFIGKIAKLKIFSKLVDNITHHKSKIALLAIVILVNMSTGEEEITEVIEYIIILR